MPVYQFISADGQVEERYYASHRKAPSVGRKITIGGRKFTRIISGGLSTALAYDFNSYPKVSSSLPNWCDGADHVKDGREAGKPIIVSRKHEDDLCRRHGFTRNYHHDDSPSP